MPTYLFKDIAKEIKHDEKFTVKELAQQVEDSPLYLIEPLERKELCLATTEIPISVNPPIYRVFLAPSNKESIDKKIQWQFLIIAETDKCYLYNGLGNYLSWRNNKEGEPVLA